MSQRPHFSDIHVKLFDGSWLTGIHLTLKVTLKKKSGAVKSGERGGQLKSEKGYIIQSQKISCRRAIVERVV